jgi:hypothetical protein
MSQFKELLIGGLVIGAAYAGAGYLVGRSEGEKLRFMQPEVIASTIIRDPEIVSAVENRSILMVYDRTDKSIPPMYFLAKDLQFCNGVHNPPYPANRNLPSNTYTEHQCYNFGRGKVVLHINPNDRENANRLHFLQQ